MSILKSSDSLENSPWGGVKVVPDGHYKQNMDRPTFRSSFDMVQVIDELKIKKKHSRFMLHPTSLFISVWYIIAISLLFYIFITVPLFVAFDYVVSKSYVGIDIFIDAFFLVDIVVNFRTGYLPNPSRPDLVVLNAEEVAKMYFKSWFFIDLISSLPLVTLSTFMSRSSWFGGPLFHEQQLKLLKLTRVIRLIKLSKISSSMGKFARVIDQAYVRLMVSYPGLVIFLQLFNLFVVAFFIVHYVACGWWLIGDMHEDSWSTSVGARDSTAQKQYLFSLYWVVTTMTTVGYGDISATNDSERAFSIFAMVLGCAFYGLLIAQITSIVADYDAHRRAIAERLDAISAYVHNKDFHPMLQKQILIYFRNFLRKHSTVDEWQILTDMSSGLRRQCISHLVSPAVARNPFFCLLKDHLTELFHIMHLQVMDRGQHITRKGQPSSDLLVLMVGSAVILDESAESVRYGQGEPILPIFDVKPGAVFGERCALGLDECYRVTVRALSNCELNVIFADELLATLGNRILGELRARFKDVNYRVRMRTYAISNIEAHDMPDLRKAMFDLPQDPIRRTWNKYGQSDQEKHKIKRRHPGRQTAIPSVLSESILKFREQHMASQGQMGLENSSEDAGGGGGGGGGGGLESEVMNIVLANEVAQLSQSVSDIRKGLNQILIHMKKAPIPDRGNSDNFDFSFSNNDKRLFKDRVHSIQLRKTKMKKELPKEHLQTNLADADKDQSCNGVPLEQSVLSSESSQSIESTPVVPFVDSIPVVTSTSSFDSIHTR